MPTSSLLLGLLLSMSAPAAPRAPQAPAPPRAPRAPRFVAPAPPAPPAWPHGPAVVWSMGHGGSHSRARLGTQVSSMTSELRTFFGAPEDAGLLVQKVEPGSAAAAASVQVGDVLVEVDGQRIERVSDVRDALADRAKGDVVQVVVVRKKKRKTLQATLTADAGPTAMAMPPLQDFELRLPPEARRFLDAETQAEIQRELERAREQLREVERQLEQLEGPGAAAPQAPEPPEPPAPPAEAPTPPDPPKAKGNKKGKRLGKARE